MKDVRRGKGIRAAAWGTSTPVKLRTCPFCRAGPNQSCRRWVAGHPKYTDDTTGTAGGYWTRVTEFHPERSGRQPKRPRAKIPPPEAFHSGL